MDRGADERTDKPAVMEVESAQETRSTFMNNKDQFRVMLQWLENMMRRKGRTECAIEDAQNEAKKVKGTYWYLRPWPDGPFAQPFRRRMR